MGNLLIGRFAASFAAAYPDILLEVHFLDRARDLLEEGFDGAVRFGPIEDSGQVARRLMDGHAVVVASPGLADITALHSPDQLDRYPAIGLANPWVGSWTLQRHGETPREVAVRPRLLLGSMLAVRDAARAGAGIAVLPALLAAPEIASGHLRHVLPGWETPRKPLTFVSPSALSVTHRLRVFIDHLARELREMMPANP